MKGFIIKYKKHIIYFLMTSILLFLIYFSLKKYTSFYHDPILIKKYVLRFGRFGFIFFILIQVFQVILFFIPGEITQIAGGYIYGTIIGTLLSMIGITLGSIATFIIARKYGDRLLEKILPQKEFVKIKNLINKPKNKKIVFILFLIPGFPKDIVGYVSGITRIKLRTFIILASIARFPGIIISNYFGSNLYHNNYIAVSVIVVITIALLVLSFKKGDKIIDMIEKGSG